MGLIHYPWVSFITPGRSFTTPRWIRSPPPWWGSSSSPWMSLIILSRVINYTSPYIYMNMYICIYLYIYIFIYIYVYTHLHSALVGCAVVGNPRPLWAGPLWAPQGPCGPGPCGLAWALVVRALLAQTGSLLAGEQNKYPGEYDLHVNKIDTVIYMYIYMYITHTMYTSICICVATYICIYILVCIHLCYIYVYVYEGIVFAV